MSPQLQLVTMQLQLAIGSPQLQLVICILAGHSTGLPQLQLDTWLGGGYLLAEPDLRAGHGPHLPHVELAGVRDQAGLS